MFSENQVVKLDKCNRMVFSWYTPLSLKFYWLFLWIFLVRKNFFGKTFPFDSSHGNSTFSYSSPQLLPIMLDSNTIQTTEQMDQLISIAKSQNSNHQLDDRSMRIGTTRPAPYQLPKHMVNCYVHCNRREALEITRIIGMQRFHK